MTFLDAYVKRMGTSDDGLRVRRRAQFENNAKRKFGADMSYVELTALEPDGTTFSEKRLQIIYDNFIQNQNPNRVKSVNFIAHPDCDMQTGTVVFDLYDKDWFVVAVQNFNGLVKRGIMQQVNYVAKWIAKDDPSKTIKQSLGLIEGLLFNRAGLDGNFFANIPEDLVKITLAHNTITDSLSRDRRLMVTESPYKITRPDNYSNENLLVLTCLEDTFSPNDRVDLGICDYQEAEVPEVDLFIFGDHFISYGIGYDYELKNIAEDDSFDHWEITTGSDYVDATISNNIITITPKSNRNNVGKTLQLKAQTTLGASTTQTLTIRSLL